MTEKVQQLITSLTKDLIEKIGLESTVEVTEKDGAMWVSVDTPDRAILIGRHGQSLEAIQILLGQLVYKKLGTWVRVAVTVGDYRERRESQLRDLAHSIAERVISSGQPEPVPYLTPAERRIVHMELAEHPEVMSESEGEGRARQLFIKPRT